MYDKWAWGIKDSFYDSRWWKVLCQCLMVFQDMIMWWDSVNYPHSISLYPREQHYDGIIHEQTGTTKNIFHTRFVEIIFYEYIFLTCSVCIYQILYSPLTLIALITTSWLVFWVKTSSPLLLIPGASQ